MKKNKFRQGVSGSITKSVFLPALHGFLLVLHRFLLVLHGLLIALGVLLLVLGALLLVLGVLLLVLGALLMARHERDARANVGKRALTLVSLYMIHMIDTAYAFVLGNSIKGLFNPFDTFLCGGERLV